MVTIRSLSTGVVLASCLTNPTVDASIDLLSAVESALLFEKCRKCLAENSLAHFESAASQIVLKKSLRRLKDQKAAAITVFNGLKVDNHAIYACGVDEDKRALSESIATSEACAGEYIPTPKEGIVASISVIKYPERGLSSSEETPLLPKQEPKTTFGQLLAVPMTPPAKRSKKLWKRIVTAVTNVMKKNTDRKH